ncbi:MAG: T9SS type A sorting domain-containing protein [Candidatus Eisenbacteria bacterium]|uniref:T9SS type A sorting domain-containing protein n=1 Tax=Eiseniibacteriota bacterium TaxID=2212470 RepID=A0A948W6I0_UNCEI|nr:T9SS type A sorting domain-containing protein [Candidatus Eisenbacteria bacterium]MBU2691150.1 T9SS type A sorting domain-containing protein [Candidatus Eisenbacteria bacterium]
MRRHALFAGIFLFLSSSVLGQSYDMKIHLANGESVIISLDDIQRIEFSGIAMGVEDSTGLGAVARAILMLQNYPNPFTPSTTIEYEIPAEADVTVRIFDVKGAQVRELVRETQGGGRHRVAWDGTDANRARVASGMYFYSVESGGQNLTRRLILVR